METVKLTALVDRQGRSWQAYRRSLRPRWSRVAAEMALAYVAMAVTAWLLSIAVSLERPWSLFWLLPGAVSFGYWMAYLQLFLHEAAHFNLAPGRQANDWLANLLIASWVGTSVANYRAIHWQHHRHHGEPDDSEHTYFYPLDARFIIEGLTGLSALRVIAFRRGQLAGDRKTPSRLMPLLALTLHGAVVAGCVLLGHWPLALAWLAGIGVFFPFFGSLRQLLEHRSVEASADINYHEVAHGRVTRMFKEGPVGSTFGAAGFSRHMLHHWDSSLSYTNFPEVERFLLDCDEARAHVSLKTSYWRAFRELFGR